MAASRCRRSCGAGTALPSDSVRSRGRSRSPSRTSAGWWVGRVKCRVLRMGVRCGVEPGGWSPVRQPVQHDALPAAFGVFSVVVAAEQGEVVDVGGAAVGPVGDVVSLALARGPVTAGEGTAAVSGGQGDGLAGGGDPGGPAEVERDALGGARSAGSAALVAVRRASPTGISVPCSLTASPWRSRSWASSMCQTVAAGVPPQAGRSPELSTALRTSPNASCIRTWCGRASRLPGTSTTPPSPGPSPALVRLGRPIGVRLSRRWVGGGGGGGGFGPGVQDDPGGFAGFLVQVGLQGEPGLPAFLP